MDTKFETDMKLSDAIEAGSKELALQIKRVPLDLREDGKLCGCGIGAAIVGVLGPELTKEVYKESGNTRGSAAPTLYEIFESLWPNIHASRVYDLNDGSNFTFKQIADRMREQGN